MEKQHFYTIPSAQTESLENLQNSSYLERRAKKENPWDQAHKLRKKKPGNDYIEPDLENQNPAATKVKEIVTPTTALEGLESLADNEYDPEWPFPKAANHPDKKFWHLEDGFSQLKSARESVKDLNKKVRIAHFDTGYDENHLSLIKGNIDKLLERNFVDNNNSAIDIGSEGMINQPGHGTGTLSILAGNTMNLPDYHHNDYIGIHNNIRIVPIRVSRSVMLWKNKAFVDALEYVISLYDTPNRINIVTMSMGGMPSKAWADVVNRAYEKGIFIVTAAGNNIGRATPSTLVYPARFERVTAACGVTYDFSPYYKPFGIRDIKVMEGNFGPRKAMKKAIAAFTPNVPWAMIGTTNSVSINGAGTSSATPQIAAAAALYYQKYYDELEALPGWKRVETIRQAMYDSSLKKIKAGFDGDVELYFGNGIIQARKMLDVKPSQVVVSMADPVSVRWPFLKIVSGTGWLESFEGQEMYEVEILQLIAKSAALQKLLDYEEKDFDALTEKEQRQFYGIILEMNDASDALKAVILENKLY